LAGARRPPNEGMEFERAKLRAISIRCDRESRVAGRGSRLPRGTANPRDLPTHPVGREEPGHALRTFVSLKYAGRTGTRPRYLGRS